MVRRSRHQGRLTFDKVEFTYQMRPDHPVIKSLTLDVPAGTTCALVGRSGSGKSTLVHLLLRFYDPSAGRVLLDGVPLPEWNLRSLHRQVALVAQDTQLFAGTILDNITYGLEEDSYTRADVEEAARGANAFDFISELPEGFLTRVGERGTRMSGGQKQRIAIARCLLRKAKILLLDEATSALDAESEASVQQALDKLISSGGATVILVAHRLSTVMNAHKIAVVNAGNVIEEGNHDELIARNGAYSALVHKQLSRQAKVVEQDALQDADVIDKILDQMDIAALPSAGRETGGSGAGGGPSSGRVSEISEQARDEVDGGQSARAAGGKKKKKK